MQKFKTYLDEAFLKAVGDSPDNVEKKEKYKDQVWVILQKSYQSIGGIKGNGFASKDDMVKSIPFWKLVIKNGKVHAVVMYKDKGGRKSVAMGSDGSTFARKHIVAIFQQEMKRSYGEKSKAALGLLLKTVPWDILEPFLIKPKDAGIIMKKDTRAIKGVNDIPKDAKLTLGKYPKLINYGYLRDIGGNPTFKVMIGTPGKNIR